MKQCTARGIEYYGSLGNMFGACWAVEAKHQDAILNATYAKLRTAVAAKSPAIAQKLVAAQRQWIAFRDTWCDFESEVHDAPKPFDAAFACKAEQTYDQIERLRAMHPEDIGVE